MRTIILQVVGYCCLMLIFIAPVRSYAMPEGTGSVQAVFTTTVVSGSCTSAIKDASGADITNGSLNFGDMYKSDVVNKTKVKNFRISFTACTGVSSASITTNAGATGLCSSSAFTSTSDTTGAAVEIWTGNDVSGTQLNCSNATASKQTINPNTAPDVSLSARMVVAADKTSGDLKSGAFSAPVVFTIEYQ